MDASDRRRRASEEAATWWVRLRTDALARADREEFVDWLRESTVHVAEMLRVAKVHNALEEFQGWVHVAVGPDDGDNGDNENVVSLPHPGFAASLSSPFLDGRQIRDGDVAIPQNSRRRLWIRAIAAGLAIVALLGALLFSLVRGHTIQTERGERREVALADGSIVEVDPQTRLRVVFEDHVRRVSLESGRALFRVTKNPARPFLVQADGITVRAVGTAFAVDHRQDGLIVTVAEGKVGVFVKETSTPEPRLLSPNSEPASARGEAVPQPRMRNADSSAGSGAKPGMKTAQRPDEVLQEIFLTAGQQVTLPTSGTGAPVRNVDSDRELAWAKGQLVFDNESVAGAVADFNRYNRLQLHVTNAALARRTVSGVFDASDPESFIGFLQTVTAVKVTRGEGEINMQ
jgi:transmembrane sensor